MDLSGSMRERRLYCPWHQGGADATKSGRPVWDGQEVEVNAMAGVYMFFSVAGLSRLLLGSIGWRRRRRRRCWLAERLA